MDFLSHMHDHIWEADNNCYLGKLCRLEPNRSKIQPSLGTMRRLPQRCFYQCHQHQCRYIQSCAKTVQYPIIEPGNDQCHDNTCHADDGLFFKKIHVASVIYLSHIGACTVQHDKPKTGQQYNNCYQTVIIIICFCFSTRPALGRCC